MKKRILLGAFLAITLGFTSVSCSSDDSKDDKSVELTPNPTDPTDPTDPGNGGGNGGGNTTTSYQHKVLLEDITGTWCPACPNASNAISQAKSNAGNGNKIAAAAIHIGNQGYPDPMQIQAGTNLYQSFFVPNYGEGGSFSFPTVTINRGATVWQQQGIAQFFNAINQQGSPVGIKIESNLTNTGGTITTNFKFSEGYENLKYNIYVIENNVKTSSVQQGGGQGANYVHNDVLRAVSGTATGNTLGTVTANQEVSKSGQNVTYTLFNNDLEKVEVIVFVTDASGKVLNVQTAHANETVDYQILN